MEIEIHLEDVDALIKKLDSIEEQNQELGIPVVMRDMRTLAQAVQYLLETNSLVKEEID